MTPKADDRYTLGFYTIVVLGILVAINLVWMIVSLIQDRIKQKVYKQIRDQKIKDWITQQMEKKYMY
jgi:hypothetical protein